VTEEIEACIARAGTLLRLGRLDEAEALLLTKQERVSADDRILSLLAGVAHARGQFDKAVSFMTQAIALNPSMPGHYSNLGNLYKFLNRDAEAIHCFEKILSLQPENIHILLQLADCSTRIGRIQNAIDYYKKTLLIDSGVPEIHCAIACVYLKAGQYDAAVCSFEEACRLRSDYGEAYHGLGDVFRLTGHFEKALTFYKRALDHPASLDIASIHSNIGTCKQYIGDIRGALNAFNDAVRSSPDRYELYTNMLMALNYSDEHEPDGVFDAHSRFQACYADKFSSSTVSYSSNKNPERKLKVAYVSSNLYDHSVAHFIAPVLDHHDSEHYEVHVYQDNEKDDAITRGLRAMSQYWTAVAGISDEELFQQIRDDDIDILVDLNGHTADNRLLVFARKPSPVQVSWIGYPNTTGLSSMDYRITDAIADPPGLTEHLHTERLVRLPDVFSCFRPADPCPVIAEPPVLEKGYITFGSFNNFAKLTPSVLELWGRLLNKYRDSHLLLKDKLFHSKEIRNRVADYFYRAGIEVSRIDLMSSDASKYEHLARYAQMDIALDPFPYNGTTTTCEALYMGVPVITLAGKAHAGRVGASFLSTVGLGEYVAKSTGQYLDLAIELAADIARLRKIRSTMRKRLISSPLFEADVFTRNLELTYRNMWREYCQYD